MALPKRQYVAAVKRGRATRYHWGGKLKEALDGFTFKPGDKFSYRVYEGGNSVECEWVRAGVFREVGKRRK